MKQIMRKESKRQMKMEEKIRDGERERRQGRRDRGRETVSILIDQTCRQPDSQGDVCPCAATLWPVDT